MKVCSSQLYYLIFTFICSLKILTLAFLSFFISGARRPHLNRFYVERIQKARLYTDRTFHFLVSLQRLATWGLGPEPSVEALAHEITTRRHELLLLLLLFLIIFEIDVFPFRNGNDEREKKQGGHGQGSQIPISSSHRQKKKEYIVESGLG